MQNIKFTGNKTVGTSSLSPSPKTFHLFRPAILGTEGELLEVSKVHGIWNIFVAHSMQTAAAGWKQDLRSIAKMSIVVIQYYQECYETKKVISKLRVKPVVVCRTSSAEELWATNWSTEDKMLAINSLLCRLLRCRKICHYMVFLPPSCKKISSVSGGREIFHTHSSRSPDYFAKISTRA